MDRFQELVWDLGEIIEVPLHVDSNHACQLILDDHLQLQMEMDSHEERLLVSSLISEIPPGKFRENVLKDALKVNSTYQIFGSFSYIENKNHLVLHKYLQTEHLSGEKLAKFLLLFIDEVEEWYKALLNNTSSPSKYNHHSTTFPKFDLLR